MGSLKCILFNENQRTELIQPVFRTGSLQQCWLCWRAWFFIWPKVYHANSNLQNYSFYFRFFLLPCVWLYHDWRFLRDVTYLSHTFSHWGKPDRASHWLHSVFNIKQVKEHTWPPIIIEWYMYLESSERKAEFLLFRKTPVPQDVTTLYMYYHTHRTVSWQFVL